MQVVWGALYRGDFDSAISLISTLDCVMFKQDMPYNLVDEGRINDDAAKVEGAYSVGGEPPVYFKGYTAPGGLLCVESCPPGAVLYRDR